jgi:hypothetical protein
MNNDIKEPTHGYQNCNTSEIIDIWWVCQGERIFVYLSYYLDQYHSKPSDMRAIWPRYLGSCMVYTKTENKNTVKHQAEPTGLKTNVKSIIYIPEWYQNMTIPHQHWLLPTRSCVGIVTMYII